MYSTGSCYQPLTMYSVYHYNVLKEVALMTYYSAQYILSEQSAYYKDTYGSAVICNE